MLKVSGVFALVVIGLMLSRNGRSVFVSGLTVTWNGGKVWVSLVTVSLTVTVTSAVPVVPVGAESRNTAFCVSVKSVALVIVTVFSGLSFESTGTASISLRMVLPEVNMPKIV